MRSKGCSHDEIRQALDQLEGESLLSSERFISDYIRSAERRGYGQSRIRWELKNRKGFDESEIEKGMAETGIDWVECARRCCRKKFGDEFPADDKGYLKRRSYLFYRGFSGDTVHAALSPDEQR